MRAAALVVVMLLGCGGERTNDVQRDGIILRIEADLRTIDNEVGQFFLDHNDFPRSLSQLTLPNPQGQIPITEKALHDPWGEPYLYDPVGRRNRGDKPDVWCEHDGWVIGNFTGFKKR